jgi:hypothetical protein
MLLYLHFRLQELLAEIIMPMRLVGKSTP